MKKKQTLLPKGPKVSGKKQLTPLEYMVSVINDPKADPARKERFAFEAAKYLHKKMPQQIEHHKDNGGGRPVKKDKPPKPLGKKEQLNVSAKTAHKKNEWGSDLQQ